MYVTEFLDRRVGYKCERIIAPPNGKFEDLTSKKMELNPIFLKVFNIGTCFSKTLSLLRF